MLFSLHLLWALSTLVSEAKTKGVGPGDSSTLVNVCRTRMVWTYVPPYVVALKVCPKEDPSYEVPYNPLVLLNEPLKTYDSEVEFNPGKISTTPSISLSYFCWSTNNDGGCRSPVIFLVLSYKSEKKKTISTTLPDLQTQGDA